MTLSNLDTDATATSTVFDIGPLDAEGWNRQGLARVARGDVRGALEDFRAATRLRADYPEAWNNMGLVRHWLEGPASALEDFNRALDLRSDYAEALNNRARSWQALGSSEAALADFDRAIESAEGPLLAGIHHNRGVLRQESGDLAQALADFDRALAIDPNHASTYLNRGEARKDSGDLEGSLDDFDRAIELLPPEASAPAYHGRGGVRVMRCEFDRAMTDYDEAIRIDPGSCVAYLSRGSACYHRRDPRGLSDYLTAMSIDPEAASKELVRVLTHGLRAGESEVLANCDQHLRINARDILAHARRGLTLVILGREEQAGPHLDLFLARAPGCLPYWDRVLRHARAVGQGHRSDDRQATPKAPASRADLVDQLFEEGDLDLGR